MTIRGTKNIIAHEPTEKTIDKRQKAVRCIETGYGWDSAKKCANAQGIPYQSLIDHLNGNTKSCRGLHYEYEENVTACREKQSAQIAKVNGELNALEEENANLRSKLYAERAENARLRADVDEMETLRKFAEIGRAVWEEQERKRAKKEALQNYITEATAERARQEEKRDKASKEMDEAISVIMLLNLEIENANNELAEMEE